MPGCVDSYYKTDSEVNDVIEVSNTMYAKYFKKYFNKMRYWHDKYSDPTVDTSDLTLTDTELEAVLTDLPLEMFGVSEELSNFKLKQGVLKLKIKELDSKVKQGVAISEDASAQLDYCRLEYAISSVVISRVEQEISFTREFIMVMKKLWDARRATDKANPIAEKSYELPEYDPLAARKIQGGQINGELPGLDF